MRSHGKLSTLNFHFQETCGHHTRQCGDLKSNDSLLTYGHVNKLSFDFKDENRLQLTWAHVTNWKRYISTFTKLMAPKLGTVVTSERRFSRETPKFSPTSCRFCVQQKKLCYCRYFSSSLQCFWTDYRMYFIIFYPGHIWPILDVLTWNVLLSYHVF